MILKSESPEALRSKLILKDVILGFFIYYNFFTIKAPCYLVISKVLLWSSITGRETGACHRLAAARRHRGSDRLLETGKKASTEIMMTFKVCPPFVLSGHTVMSQSRDYTDEVFQDQCSLWEKAASVSRLWPLRHLRPFAWTRNVWRKSLYF